jgi:hypothetical protein
MACGLRRVTFGLACMVYRTGALGRAANQGGRPASEPLDPSVIFVKTVIRVTLC